jgi:hypothetical protein
VEERKIKKYKYFLDGYLGGVKGEKTKNLRFTERRIEAPPLSHPFTKEDRHYTLSVLFA